MKLYEQALYLKDGVDTNHTLVDMLEAIELQLHDYPALSVLVADIQAWLPKYNQYLKEGKTTVLRVLTQMYFQQCLDLFGAIFIRDDNRVFFDASEKADLNTGLKDRTYAIMTILAEWLVDGSYVKIGVPTGVWQFTLMENVVVTEFAQYAHSDRKFDFPLDTTLDKIVAIYEEKQAKLNTKPL